ncbi:alkylmercury lyase [Longispora sp. NPDC051575]|uniref:alkylmercury lyase n=1 Tax=Longispora sp. NPDC051575 TaxID=3154943 RepID=UPI003416C819
MLIELRSVPGCPNLAPARELLRACLAELGLAAEVLELVGDYPSPTVLVNGTDVMGCTGSGASCRLDLPTFEAIRAALAIATRQAG